MTKPRLLLVDDDPHWLDIASLHFELSGFCVVTSKSAERAQALINEHRFDVIVTDLEMPGESGWHFRRRLRNLRGCRKIPIVILSARKAADDGLQIRPRLSKDQDFEEIASTLHSIVSLAENRRSKPSELDSVPSIFHHPERLKRRLRILISEFGKRAMDVLLSLLLMVFALPIGILIAVVIKVEDRGPVFFSQNRVGRNGRLICFRKFRSMCVNAEKFREQLLAENDHEDSITFKMRKDPRITRVGRFLRRTSLDELPQLWNVLIGEMSLVGPRPPIPEEVASYGLRAWRRLNARPGLTGLWQVSGRGDLPFSDQLRLDCRYIQERSMLKDIVILGRTIPAVLSGRGAY